MEDSDRKSRENGSPEWRRLCNAVKALSYWHRIIETSRDEGMRIAALGGMALARREYERAWNDWGAESERAIMDELKTQFPILEMSIDGPGPLPAIGEPAAELDEPGVLDIGIRVEVMANAVGPFWRYCTRDDLPIHVQHEIEQHVIKFDLDECGSFCATNGWYYRWKPYAV